MSINRGSSMQGSSMQNELTDPVTLTPKTVPLLGYTKVIPYIKFEQFGINRFRVMPHTNQQTDRQTDGLKNPTYADRHSRLG